MGQRNEHYDNKSLFFVNKTQKSHSFKAIVVNTFPQNLLQNAQENLQKEQDDLNNLLEEKLQQKELDDSCTQEFGVIKASHC